MSIGNKYAYQARNFRPPQPKRKPTATTVRLSNATAELVLRERKVEIKDLESRVTYLQNQIKALKVENKTQRDAINRQEKELRKFKDGVTDIPFLLRSHKDEIKAFESNASSLRRELRDCQKELKSKCDAILRKDQQIEKLTASSRRHERHLQEINVENKELKSERKKLEEECKKLSASNEELKSKNERLHKKVQHMTSKILNLEESLGSSDHHRSQLREDLTKLQKSHDELQQIVTSKHSQLVTAETQTEKQPVNIEIQALSSAPQNSSNKLHEDKSIEADASEETCEIMNTYGVNMKNKKSIQPLKKSEDARQGQSRNCHPIVKDAKVHKKLLKPMKSRSYQHKSDFLPVDSNSDNRQYFSFNSPYIPSNIYPPPSKNENYFKSSHKKS